MKPLKYTRKTNKADGIFRSLREVLISNCVIQPVFNRLKMIFPKSKWHTSKAESDRLQLAEQALYCMLILKAAIVKEPPGFLLVALLFLLRTAKILLFNINYMGKWRKTNKKERFIFLKIRSKITFNQNTMSVDQIWCSLLISSPQNIINNCGWKTQVQNMKI